MILSTVSVSPPDLTAARRLIDDHLEKLLHHPEDHHSETEDTT